MLISVLASRAVLSTDLVNTLFEELCRPAPLRGANAGPTAARGNGAQGPTAGAGEGIPQEHLLLMVHLAKVSPYSLGTGFPLRRWAPAPREDPWRACTLFPPSVMLPAIGAVGALASCTAVL